MTIKEALNLAIREFKNNEVSEPQSSAEVLLFNVLEKNRTFLYSHGEDKLTAEEENTFLNFIERRKTHEPVWYILEEVEFYGRKFKINNNVLTPRPETELLVEEVLKEITNYQLLITNQFQSKNEQMTIVELGTGAGGIIITLAKELERISSSPVIPAQAGIQKPQELDSRLRGNDEVENWNDSGYSSSEVERNREVKNDSSRIPRTINYIATDISEKALEIAKVNAKRLGANIEFLEGDLLEPIANSQKQIATNSLIVANLPYIPEEDMTSLQFDVLHHEPRVALSGGRGGIEIYERLINDLKKIDFKGTAFFEIGIEQGDLLKPIVKKIFPHAEVQVKGDFANIDRIVRIEFK